MNTKEKIKIGVICNPQEKIGDYLNWIDRISSEYDHINFEYRELQLNDMGDDIDVLIIGGDSLNGNDKIINEFNSFYYEVLMKHYAKKTRILAIDWGFHLINASVGGVNEKINYDIYNRHSTEAKTGYSVWHMNTLYLPLPNKKEKFKGIHNFQVNSKHKNHVHILGRGMVPICYSDDGIIEGAIGHDDSLFIQWHPELPELSGWVGSEIIERWIVNGFKKLTGKAPVKN